MSDLLVRGAPEADVSHTTRDKVKLLNRVRRIRGQIEAGERLTDVVRTYLK
jgi:hypothetical protein